MLVFTPLQVIVEVAGLAIGVVLGAAVPLPTALTQPFAKVVVTLYVPADTVIADVVSVVLHNNEPDDMVLNVEVFPQLLITVTTGVAGPVLGVATTVATGLTHPFAVTWVSEYVPATLTAITAKCDPPGFHVIVPV